MSVSTGLQNIYITYIYYNIYKTYTVFLGKCAICFADHLDFLTLVSFFPSPRLLQLHQAVVKGSGNLPNELLYGRVGFLYALVFVNQQLGQDRIPLQYIQQVGQQQAIAANFILLVRGYSVLLFSGFSGADVCFMSNSSPPISSDSADVYEAGCVVSFLRSARLCSWQVRNSAGGWGRRTTAPWCMSGTGSSTSVPPTAWQASTTTWCRCGRCTVVVASGWISNVLIAKVLMIDCVLGCHLCSPVCWPWSVLYWLRPSAARLCQRSGVRSQAGEAQRWPRMSPQIPNGELPSLRWGWAGPAGALVPRLSGCDLHAAAGLQGEQAETRCSFTVPSCGSFGY